MEISSRRSNLKSSILIKLWIRKCLILFSKDLIAITSQVNLGNKLDNTKLLVILIFTPSSMNKLTKNLFSHSPKNLKYPSLMLWRKTRDPSIILKGPTTPQIIIIQWKGWVIFRPSPVTWWMDKICVRIDSITVIHQNTELGLPFSSNNSQVDIFDNCINFIDMKSIKHIQEDH